ncbi:TPA: hypothetical protein U1B14_002271 [Streptococcus suis]|uniref:hypothetical protein n=1 Tax=Streptococcus TaxID=1301 RepID=UPI000422FAE9|nr:MULTISPECIES: hypothetical protein [Streptococcus]MBM7137292.1 hypothetical protein [Streptococcus suis]MBM7191687.1 hypothetical protein [Streptococcus suis]MBO3756471.1 hypothetical protein [Streptococcus suis]MBO4111186.1 hypothetical protein [Streptococcus suis]MBY0720594.1 hypothetical protein [Streptococcus sp. 2018110]
MIEDLKKILDICERYNQMLGESLESNDDLKDLKESIECYLEKDYLKLQSAIESFDKVMVDSDERDERYNRFYQQMLSSMSDFAVYFDDFHKVIFRLNKKRNLLKGIITITEYEDSDIVKITHEE